MTSIRERYLQTMIYLLQQELEALRSVLSEFETDKSHYVQWNRAEILREAIETLEHQL